MEPEPLIPKHGAYRKLKSFQIAQLCYDVTVRLFDRYISELLSESQRLCESQRDSIIQPKVAESARLPWDVRLILPQPQRGCIPPAPRQCNPGGLMGMMIPFPRYLETSLPPDYAERLAAKAHHLYPRHRQFHKALNRPGNRGRDERARLLERVTRDGFIADYSGVRVGRTGRRFRIAQATVWNLLTPDGAPCGQAAMFSEWSFLNR